MSNQLIKFSLTAIEARDLLSADSNGFSDPYFKIPHKQRGFVDIPGKNHKTKWIKKTLNPVWNHTFESVEFNPTVTKNLQIEVYDYDRFGKDDLIGTAYINLDWMLNGQQDFLDAWIPLTVSIKDKKTKITQNMQKGSAHVKLQVKFRPPQYMNAQGPVQSQMIQPQGQYPMPMQPNIGQPNAPNMYPSYNQVISQSQIGGQQPMMQPLQIPPGQQPLQRQYSQPPNAQQTMQQPATQPPISQPPYQPQMGQIPQNQVPNVQQSPVGQQHAKIPMFQSAIQPQPPYQQNQGQPSLMRVQTHSPQPMFPQMPAQPNLLNRQATFQQQSYQPPPQMQYSMMQPQIYGPHPGIYPPQYSQPPLPYQMPPQQGVNMMHPGIPIVSHKRGDALQPGSWIPVNEPVVQVGLGWDFTGGETFDLDASITGFDEKYNVIESIYFNNKRGLNNSVIHFGDNVTGEGEGDDEVIKVVLNKVPNRVRFLAVTINSYKNNSLIRAKSAYIRIYTSSYHIGKYVLNRTKDCIGLLLGVFERDPIQNIWYFRVMADPIRGNKVTLSYEDIKTLLGSYSMANADSPSRINHPLPGEPLFEFNKWIRLQNRFTYVGLGWHIQSGQNYDLDASIMTFDKMNNLMEIIYHENLQSYNKSIIHYGDNRTGLGEGDDEVLSIDFAKVDPNTFTMAVVINSFKGNSMNFVLNAFVRLYDTQKPIGVHILNNCPECVGLCMGLLRKDTDGVWYFCAIKDIVSGIVCTQSVNDVKYLLDKYPLKI